MKEVANSNEGALLPNFSHSFDPFVQSMPPLLYLILFAFYTGLRGSVNSMGKLRPAAIGEGKLYELRVLAFKTMQTKHRIIDALQ